MFPESNGNGTVNFFGSPGKGSIFDAAFWVVDTDYTNWIIVYSCTDFGLFYLDSVWVMVRDLNYNTAPIKDWFAAQKVAGTLTTYDFPDSFHKTK